MKKSTRIILWVVCIVICVAAISVGAVYGASGSFGIIVDGDGNVTSKEYAFNVTNYTVKRISVANLVPEIKFVKAEDGKIVVKTDGNIADAIDVTCSANRVTIKGDWYSVYNATEFVVTIYYTDLDEVKLRGKLDVSLDGITADANVNVSGSVDVSATNCDTDALSFDISGSCEAVISGTIGELNLSASGSSKTTLKGSISNLKMNISGSGEYTGSELICTSIRIGCSGSAKIALSGSCDTLNVDASGNMDLSAEQLISRLVTIDCSGSTFAKVNVQEKLTVDLSGSCNITYYGNPAIEQKVSGSCSISRGN